MEHYSSQLDALFHALSDPTRRAVLGRLGKGPASISELAGPFDMALPSFMKHILLLEESGWIRTRKRGRVRTYSLAPQQLKFAEDRLGRQRKLWEARLDRLDAYLQSTSPPAKKGKRNARSR